MGGSVQATWSGRDGVALPLNEGKTDALSVEIAREDG